MQNLNKPWPFAFKNGKRNWVNFHWSIQMSEKVYIDGLFLSKVYNVSAKKFQKNYVSWHWRVMQNLKENCLPAWKMTKGIWLIFMRPVESLEICTLMGSFFSKTHKDVDEKEQKSYISWHWRVKQSLKKNWFLVPKMTWEIW